MENNIEEHAYGINNTKNVVIGLLIGGLAGAAAMLLFTPQSGKRTRAQIHQIQQKSIQLRDRTTNNIIKAVVQVRSETNRITAEVQEKAGELKQLGQDKLVKQLDRVSAVLDAGKTAVEAA
jgi:gas vesicle protein